MTSFDDDFRNLTGLTPLSWQRRLYVDHFARGDIPSAIDVPTGLGKTSVIALWLIARAHSVPLPRRLVYVVDRRAVVDQATDEAEKLRDALEGKAAHFDKLDGSERAQAKQITAQLKQLLGFDGKRALPISTLRGAQVDNREWLDDPTAPAIIVGTVDMTGSRLLFEGYGVSRKMRPAHAGLLGVDSLIVLDEAHLVPPFEAVVREAAGMSRPQPLPAMRVIGLSATGRDGVETVFRINDADRADPRAKARLEATKRLWLMADASAKDVAQRLADQAWSFGEGGRRVVVFCNSRKTAQEVQTTLKKKQREAKAFKGLELTALLVGERRFRERQFATTLATPDMGDEIPADLKSQAEVFRRFLPGRAGTSEHPAFLIATSAGEVGVDLDADDLVCDVVAWERMVQRFGRVNRRAELGEARIAVIPVADEKEAEDEVKAERLAVLKAPFLSADWPGAPASAAGSPPPPVAEPWPKDASPGTLADLKAGPLKPLINAAMTEAPLRPPLIRATLDAWSLTSLEEHPGRPKVEPWLRGWIDKEPQTTVLWRRIFPLRAGEVGVTDELRAFFEVASPHMSETLEAPTWRVAEILRERAKRMTKGSPESDAETADPDDGSVLEDQEESEAEKAEQPALPGERSPNHRPVVVIMKQDGTIERVALIETFRNQDTKRLAAALAGRTVVIDARTGGLDANGLLDPKADDVPLTSDMANREAWGQALLRASGRRVGFGEKPAGDLSAKRAWRLEPFRWAMSDGDESAGIWIEVWRGVDGERPGDPAVSRRAQVLDEHHAQAEKHARRIATALNIPAPQRTMLAAVAAIHDRGKDRKLWQDAMGARREGRPYAKTMGGGNSRALNGYRHEFGTLRELAAGKIALPQDIEGDEALRDLALHLIAAHHGHARPIIMPLDPDPDGPLPSELAPLAREAALRFARLQRLWGPWGLAWWETLLRAADWAASRANDEREVGDD